MPTSDFSRRRFLSSLTSGAVVGLAGCSTIERGPEVESIPDATPGPDDWPTSGYDARNSRYNANASPPRSNPTERWNRDCHYCHTPMVRGSRVVVNADDSTMGIRATDGEQVWESVSEPWGYPTPMLGTKRAYVTGPDCVFGVDLENGEETWQGEPCIGWNSSSGTLANGQFYLQYGGYFSALDATGRVMWASPHDAQGSPAVLGDTAYVATAFTAEAVDLTAAANEWPWEDPDDDEPPHASEDASTDWSVPATAGVAGQRVYWSPSVSGASVLFVVERHNQAGGELRSVMRDTGVAEWKISSLSGRQSNESTRDAPDPVGRPTPPVVTEDLVLSALGDRQLLAANHLGEIEWALQLDREVIELAGGGDVLLAITHDRTIESTKPGHAALEAFDVESGSRLWKRVFEDHVEGLAIAGGTVYVTVVTERRADDDVVGQRLIALG